MDTPAGYEKELASVRAMVQPDGFDVDVVGETDGTLDLRLFTTTPDACEDCIVPKAVMIPILNAHLEPFGLQVGDITYPSNLH